MGNSKHLERVADGLLGLIPPKPKKKNKKRKHIPRMTYRQYMGSAYWRKRRNDYFSKHGRKCAVCESSSVQLHHKQYDPKLYGREPDDHLVALCGTHHSLFHELYEGVPKHMHAKTNVFIKHQRQIEAFDESTSWLAHIV